MPAMTRLLYSVSTPMLVRCMTSTISRSTPRGVTPSLRQFSCCSGGRPVDERQRALLLAELGKARLGDALGDLVHVLGPSTGMPELIGEGAQLELVARRRSRAPRRGRPGGGGGPPTDRGRSGRTSRPPCRARADGRRSCRRSRRRPPPGAAWCRAGRGCTGRDGRRCSRCPASPILHWVPMAA